MNSELQSFVAVKCDRDSNRTKFGMQSYLEELVFHHADNSLSANTFSNNFHPVVSTCENGVFRTALESMHDRDSQHQDLLSNLTPIPGSSHVCRVCDKTFRASSLLDIHMRVHVGAKPFVCPMCGHRATQKGNLKLHMKKHHGADLPPHIDLVPDSGIWGHPQENMLCGNADINNNDFSGRRKQVAQAVSSMLDEEIVELIKKCQNNLGQGMTGRITESLEDFIHIAKGKRSHDINFDSSNLTISSGLENKTAMHTSERSSCYSTDFLPHIPSNVTTQDADACTDVLQQPNVKTKWGKIGVGGNYQCFLCNRTVEQRNLKQNNENNAGLMCSFCMHDAVSQFSQGNRTKSSRKRNKEECDLGSTFINEVLSPESNHSVIYINLTCDECGSVFLEENLFENHKQSHRHNRKQITDVKAAKLNKTEYMNELGLVKKSSVVCKDVVRSNSTVGLNPVVGYMALMLSKNICVTTVVKGNKSMKKKWLCRDMQSKRFIHTKNIAKNRCNFEVMKRASPSVLKMLRQTVLNSVEQKMTDGGVSHRTGSCTDNSVFKQEDMLSTSIPLEVKQLEQHRSPYRNPAMQSLAQIGKSLLCTDESEPETKSVKFQHSQSPVFQNISQVCSVNLTENLQSIMLNLKEQGNSGFCCNFCPKWFKYRSVLEIHMRSHTGERPYKCPYCEYAGTQHNCLKLHIQRHHPREYMLNHADMLGNKGPGLTMTSTSPEPCSSRVDVVTNRVSCFSPVKCPICSRVSPSPGYLKIHMRSHKKSLDHVCHVCGRGFKEYWYLTTHLKTHGRELSSMTIDNVHDSKSTLPLSFLPPSAKTQGSLNLPFLNEIENIVYHSSKSSYNGRHMQDQKENKSSAGALVHEIDFATSGLAVGNSNNSNRKIDLLSFNVPQDFTKSTFKQIETTKTNLIQPNTEHNSAVDTQHSLYPKTNSHVNRRKAAFPSKVTMQPSPTDDNNSLPKRRIIDVQMLRRKCRPRKVYKGTYLAPPLLSKLYFGNLKSKEHSSKYVSDSNDERDLDNSDDLPLDLSCTHKKFDQHGADVTQSDQNKNDHNEPLDLSKT